MRAVLVAVSDAFGVEKPQKPKPKPIAGMVVVLQASGWRKRLHRVATFTEASEAVRAYIAEMNIGASEWLGGDILNEGQKVASVSYNGRVWDEGGEIEVGGAK
jgi:hypothetical protein